MACKYCFITEHDTRREVWNQNPIAGVNRACTFVNVTPWAGDYPEERERFKRFPWDLLIGDTVGFTAITDPLYPRVGWALDIWLAEAAPRAKLITAVTKWPVSKSMMSRLAQIENFRLVVSITGNDKIEKVSTEKHLQTLALAREAGVPALPVVHPYIAGVSDLSFLPELKRLGYDAIDVKGLRYCDARMGGWMPADSKRFYHNEDEEILPEDGWRERVQGAGITLQSPREWYLSEAVGRAPRLSPETAERVVTQIFKLANVVSSSAEKVREAAINRRL